MFVEELAFGIAVYADVWIQANDFAAPELSAVSFCDKRLERCRAPKQFCESGIVDLKAIIHSYGITLFGFPRSRGERQGGQESYVILAESRGPEVWYCDNLTRQNMLQGQIRLWNEWTEGGPIGGGFGRRWRLSLALLFGSHVTVQYFWVGTSAALSLH